MIFILLFSAIIFLITQNKREQREIFYQLNEHTIGIMTKSIISSVCARRSDEAFNVWSFSYTLPNRVTVKRGPDGGFTLNKRPSLDT